MRTMFYYDYEPIQEENESKLSSQGDIRTDRSNTDESFSLDVHQYIDFCDEPVDGDNLCERKPSEGRGRAFSEVQDVQQKYSVGVHPDKTLKPSFTQQK